ncbi:MAG: PAS domain S-box protein [Smithella sp.]|jgi:PAS domain S-box-containing protein
MKQKSVETHRNNTGAQDNVNRRERTEEELRQEEQRFRAFVEHSSDIIVLLNLEGIITYINPAVERVLGFKPEERIGAKGFELAHPDEIKFLADSFNTLARDTNSPIIQGEMRLRHKDGSWRTVESVGSNLVNNNIVEAVIVNYRDITERKRSEDALRHSEEKYRTILENIEEGYFEVDFAGNFTFFNDNVCRVLGYPREELMDMNNRKYTDKKEFNKVFQAYNKVYKTGEPNTEFVQQVTRKDGTKRYIEGSISIQKDSSGKPRGFRGIARDITERKQTEEKLRNDQQELHAIMDVLPIGVSWADMQGNIKYTNFKFHEIFGYTIGEIPNVNAWLLRAYPDPAYREHVLSLLSLRIEAQAQGKDTDPADLKVVCKNGSVRHVLQTMLFTSNRILVIYYDVTERQQRDEDLKRTVDSLRKAFGTVIQVMVSAVEMRDPYTAGHQIRSADLARAIATEMGLPQEEIDGIRIAGSIHDIGKLSIPAEILSKPTKLNDLEFSLVKKHAQSGYEMLKDLESPWPLAEIVFQHHERINGSGYPRNLKGNEILIEARIMAVADVVEAMASHRPYRPTLGIEAALEEIEKNKGVLYDDTVADACLRLFREKGYQLP